MEQAAQDPTHPDGILAAYAPGLLDRIEEAGTIDGLAVAAAGHGGLVRVLAQVGVPVMAVAGAVALLNARLMERLFRLTVPPGVADHACLIVMGSEGRAEQILRTDQDNGLILPDDGPWDAAALAEPLALFSFRLTELGWPPCPGGVMVSNPDWVRRAGAFAEAVRLWIRLPDDAAFMRLAIFADAAAAAGDAGLLDGARAAMLETVAGHGAFLSQFARVALQFETPLGLFGQFDTDRHGRMDLKKGGIFPIVHGVRALALEAGLAETNTVARLAALSEAGRLEKGLAVDLRAAFEFLSALRLKARINDDHAATDTLVEPARLDADEREELRHALRTVKQFKELLTYHFHLGMF